VKLTSWQDVEAAAHEALNVGDLKLALDLYNQLLQANANSGNAHLGLGRVLCELEHFDKAIQHLSKSCELLPTRADCLLELANCFDTVNSHQDVKTVLEFASKQFPTNFNVIYQLALFEKETGHFARAEALVNTAINQLNVDTSQTDYLTQILHLYMLKLSLPCAHDLIDFHQQLDKLIVGISDEQDTMLWHYLKGSLFEKEKNYENAYAHWHKANQLQVKKATFKTTELSHLFTQILKLGDITNHPVSVNANSDFCPIFVLGLPRTGSTLLEQLLSEYDNVSTLGEEALIAKHAAAYLSHRTHLAFPQFLERLTVADTRHAAQLYRDALHKRQLTTKFVVDKLPANFQSIDLILTLFPNAKILHIRRDFGDVAISIFKNYFAENEPYFCDLQELDEYRRHYEELMAHFHNKYPRAIFDVNYEALVNDTKKCMQGIANYCGLSQSKNKEVGHSSNTSNTNNSGSSNLTRVKTLSAGQVRGPISTRSIGIHKHYKSQLHAAGLIISE
jgi:tetratricopeptide (TPR) repeat protein